MEAIALKRKLCGAFSWLRIRRPPTGRPRSLRYYMDSCIFISSSRHRPSIDVCTVDRLFALLSTSLFMSEIILHRFLLLLIRRWALCLEAFNKHLYYSLSVMILTDINVM
ncbi:hypothetical protein BDV10DRAFT_53648 [Aspergillus recurvatus]